MRNQEWDAAAAQLDALDLAQLVLGLLVLDTVDGEASLGVVDEAEVLASLLEGDDVHEASRVGGISADLAVDLLKVQVSLSCPLLNLEDICGLRASNSYLDETLHQDRLGLTVVQGVLETVADEDDERHAVAQLVRTSGRSRGIVAAEFVQEPVARRGETLLVLLRCR